MRVAMTATEAAGSQPRFGVNRTRFFPPLAAAFAAAFLALDPLTAFAVPSISPPATVTFTAVTLSGADQQTTAMPAVGVTDNDAVSNGWSLTLSTTAFSGQNGASIPDPALSIRSAPSVACASTCSSMPTNSVSYAVSIPQNNVAVKWFNAALGTGLGSFTITPQLTLAIPAKSFAGSYVATETYSIVIGP